MKPLSTQFLAKLKHLVAGKIARSADGSRRISDSTQNTRWQELVLGFEIIHDAGYTLASPENLKQKHIQAMCQEMETRKLSASVIQRRLSIFRVFCDWIGKPGMIGAPENYVQDPGVVKRIYGADRDKGWEANQVDWAETMVKAAELDGRLRAIIGLGYHFGLRAKEALMFRPKTDDLGAMLYIVRGTKGGRARPVPVESKEQRDFLEQFVHPLASKATDSMCWPDRNFEQSQRRFYYLIGERMGITRAQYDTSFHGLRHDYVNRKLEERGYTSPVKGGDHQAQVKADSATVDRARMQVMQFVGHARTVITTAYSGPVKKTKASRLTMPPLPDAGDQVQGAGATPHTDNTGTDAGSE